MFIYTSIFLASLVLAVVALVLYRTISDSSRSVYSSKEPIAIISRPSDDKGGKASGSRVATAQPARSQARRATPQDLATPYAATPTDKINLGWEPELNKVGEQNLSFAGAANVSRCSLYDVSATTESTSGSKGGVDWSFSEEKRAKRVSTENAPRKAAARPSDPENSKPWGW